MSDKSTAGPMSRRAFLRGVGTTVAALGLHHGCSGPPSSSPYGGLRVGFQSYSLRAFVDVEEFVAQASRLGLRYAELWRGHLPLATPEDGIVLRERLAQARIVVDAFGVERFTSDHEANRALFEIGRVLGVRNISANPALDAFDSIEELAVEYDIRVAIHNHGPRDQWERPEWVLEAVSGRDARIGATVDTGHLLRSELDPVEAIYLLGGRVLGVHLKDFLLVDGREEEHELGEGGLDLHGVIDALFGVGFTGPLSVEYESDVDDPTPAMLRSLARVREVIRARL